MPALSTPDNANAIDTQAIQTLLSASPKSVLFLPLYGEAHSEPLCFVLRVEGITCLLDCGWSESCDLSLIKPLGLIAPHVDVVLLSHADIKHLGAIPYAVAKLGLQAPIYATLPVQKMGQMYVYDLLVSKEEVSDFDAFDLDDVDAAFDRIIGVRYSQQVVLTAKEELRASSRGGSARDRLADVRITAHAAGHSIGGAVWHISAQQQDFVYAVSMNLKSDSHLMACSIQSLFHRPALLVTDASCAGRAEPPANQARAFLDCVLGVLRHSQGNVLIPVDSAGRVLELIILLEQHWLRHRLSYPLVFLSRTSATVMDFAKSQLEFCSEAFQKDFTGGHGDNPFTFKHLQLCSALEDLVHLPQQHNLVVLASSSTLDLGLSQQLLLHWAIKPENQIIFTSSAPPSSLAYALQHHARSGARGPLKLDLRVGRRVPLTPAEIKEKEEREALEAAKAGKLQPKDEAVEMDIDPRPDDAGLAATRQNTATVAQHGRAGSVVHTLPEEGPEAPRRGGGEAGEAFAGVLIDGFVPPPGAVAPMFAYDDSAERQAWDEFGVRGADLHELFGRTHYDDDDDVAPDVAAPPDDVVTIQQRGPTKVVYDTVELEVNARMAMFDFEGLIHESSFVSMLRVVAPRNLLLVQRPPNLKSTVLPRVTASLSSLLTHVHEPSTMQPITLPATACYAALLSEALNQAIEGERQKPHSGYSLQWFDSVVASVDPLSHLPVLDKPPPEDPDLHTPAAVFMGDMLLSDILPKLKAAGLDVKIQGMCALVQGGKVIIRQADNRAQSQLVIEGSLTPLYYQVRDIVFNLYRLIS